MSNIKIKILSCLVSMLFKMLGLVVKIKGVNYPKEPQFILALWHAHQCVLYNVKPPERLNVLISRSNDGEIITAATKAMGFNVVRGSRGRKGAEAALKLIEKLEQGQNIAITVDGPKGPNRVVKNGVINIAKLSQVPIIPVSWHSTSKFFVKFNSWDGFRFPIVGLKSVALYGEPIYVPQDCDDICIEQYRLKLEEELHRLEQDIVENYDEYLNS